MKDIILSLALLFIASKSVAQDHTQCSMANHSELSLTVISKDISTINNTITFQFCLKTMDSSIQIDTLLFDSEFASFTGFSTTLTQGNYTSADSVTYSITFQCDTSQLPYYPKEIQFAVVTGKDIYRTQAMVYFTPWNTIKIMNFTDFHDPSFAWTLGNDDAQRTRSFIPTDSFQMSYDSTLPTAYKSIDGSAISIPYNYDTAFVDTDTSNGQYKFSIMREFKGRLKGRIQVPHRNDWLNNVLVDIANLRIAIIQDRGKGGLKLLTEGYTDEDGNFSIDYSRNILATYDDIHVFAFIVEDTRDVFGINGDFDYSQYHLPIQIDNWDDGAFSEFDYGTIQMPISSGLLALHWAQRAIDFAKTNLDNSVQVCSVDFLINAGSVADGQWSFYQLSKKRITLATEHIASERIVYHEMGHHVHLAMLQDGKRQTGKGGTHTLDRNNASPNQTIVEGFANGYEPMVDSRYFLDDNEANGGIHGVGWLRTATHPFVAEIRFSSFLMDLFDAVNKFQSYGISYPRPDGLRADRINDVSGIVTLDNLSLSLQTICQPFIDNRGCDGCTIQDVQDYVSSLIVGKSCSEKREIKRLADFNFEHSPFSSTDRVNTDEISTFRTITHTDENLRNDRGAAVSDGLTTYTHDYRLDPTALEFDGLSYNFCNTNVTSKQLSDNISLDHATLFMNNNSNPGWSHIQSPFFTVPSPANVAMSVEVCADEISLSDNGSFIVGDQTGTINTTANVRFTNGSELSTGQGVGFPSVIEINNNSTLIIEVGATIRIGPNTQIILDGPNAILEIRGNLVIEDGATFAPTGGPNGQGFVRFNTFGVWNGATAIAKVDVGVNSNMVFEAASGNTKVLEIAGESLWIDDKNNTNFVFTLKNATAEISHEGILNLGCRAVFDGATVQKMVSAGHYKGVYLCGKSG